MTPPYLDASLPTEERVQDLLGRMSLDEKVAQLGSAYVYELLDLGVLDNNRAAEILQHGIGQITRIGGASSLDPSGVAAAANAIQTYLRENTRLGIPAFVHEECAAGYMAAEATSFPHIIGMAASWDPEVPFRAGEIAARQMREAGAHQGLGPVLDVCRDPRWGRIEETFGEDPYLVATQAAAFIEGLQSGDGARAVVATAKHFAGHGVPEGGMNAAPPHIGSRELRDVFLMPFEAAVRVADVESFMHAYHEIDGIPCIANRELMVDVLRDGWGFDGTMVSDYNGVEELEASHEMASSLSEAAKIALEAGVDVELPSTVAYGEPLFNAVAAGDVDISIVDRSVARVLRQKFDLGLFEDPFVEATGMEVTAADGAIAEEAARRSLVLLENDAGTLPLASDVSSIAVLGPSAASARYQIGDYSHAAHLENLAEAQVGVAVFNAAPEGEIVQTDLSGVPSVLDAIVDRAGPGVRVRHAAGCGINDDDRSGFGEAIEAAESCDVAVLVVGGKSGLADDCTTGEFRDRTDIGLPGVQRELVEKVAATGTPVVLVILSGRPLSVPDSRAAAVLHAWLPGEHGARAVAGALFGDFSPGGKLPITVPRHVGQVPIYHGHKPSGGRSRLKGEYVDRSNTPLYPFGYGASYTSFVVSPPELSSAEVATDGSVRVSVRVENTGSMPGDEVVQVYGRRRGVSVTRPVRELVGFRRVSLEPGETCMVLFEINADLFGFHDRDLRFVVEPGSVTIASGTSSRDLSGTAELELVGPTVVEPKRTFFSAVTVT